MRKKENLSNLLILGILSVNFMVTGLFFGNNILNDGNSLQQKDTSLPTSSVPPTDIEVPNTLNEQLDNYEKQLVESSRDRLHPSLHIQPWGNSYFSYRKDIIFDSSLVNGTNDLPNFPLLVDLYDTDLRTKVQSDGDDIMFTDNSGTKLDHELELFDQSYNNTHAHLSAWIRIPNLSASVDTLITMYYGNSTIGTQETPSSVWNANYMGVWHLNEAIGGVNAIKDSTTNNNHGTDYNSPTFGQTGVINNAIEFDGTNQYIDIPNSATLENVNEGDYTYETWFYANQIPPGTVANANDKRYGALIKKDPHGGIYYDHDKTFSMEHWLLGPTQTGVVSTTYNPQFFYHLVGVVSKTDGYTKLYVNGNLEGTDTWTPGSTAHDYTTVSIKFGIANPGAAIYRWNLDGRLDEMRISNTARSGDWIATEYNNQFNSTSFFTVDAEEFRWVSSDYFYRKSINIDNTKVSGTSTLSDFPFLLDLYDKDLRSKVQSDGDDIFFTDSSGTKIAHEFERFNQTYNSTHAHLVAWIRLTILFPTIDTQIWMYYGNSTVSSNENAAGVWNSNYKGVWHLSEDPSGTSPQMLDSTSNNYDGTTAGTMTSNDRVSGQILGGIEFDGVDDYITTNYAGITGSNVRTISFWINTSALEDRDIISYGDFGFNRFVIRIDENSNRTGDWVIRLEMRDSTILLEQRWTTHISDGNWHYVSVVIPQDVDISQTRCYIDGQLESIDTTYGTGIASSGSGGANNFQIAYNLNKNFFLGTLDEIRISSADYSVDWIVTEYNNQFNPETFYTINSEEFQFSWPHTDYLYRKSITIDNSKVIGSTNLADFPVLIELYDSDLRTKAQSDGDDIMFIYNDNLKLDHEIEVFNQTYNSTHAHLVAWVRIPNLYATVDTKIFMYYGNSTITSQENPEGVWNSNFKVVHHLEEDPTGTIYDSTGNNYDATSFGSMTSNNLVSGKINGALDFDGTDDYISWVTAISSTTGTYSWWMYAHNVTGERNYIADNAYRRRISLWDDVVKIETDTDAEYFDFSSSSISPNVWTRVTFVRSGDVGDLYVNGSWVQQVTVTGADLLTLSAIGGTVEVTRMVDGLMDEVRILNTTLSGDWIKTEYNNQFDPSSFYSVESEQSQLNWPHTDYQFRKTITVDHTKVNGSSDLENFPVLIELFDSDLRTKVQPDGEDIIFTGEFSGKLDHEFEVFNQTYNSTHAHLVAWIRIPKLSGSLDTEIVMYYGNSSLSRQENPEGVWENNYAGVWHLSESPVGLLYDSTPNSNDGTPSNSPFQINGKINYGLSFDDSNERAVNVSHSSSLQLPSTIVASSWIKTTDSDSDVGIVVNKWGQNPANRNYWLGKLDANWFAFFVDDVQEVRYALSNLNDGNWHYVVGIAEGSTLRLFVDGFEVNSTSYDGSSVIGTSNLAIGHSVEVINQEWNGFIDEVRISSNWVSSNWIITEYNNQLEPSSFSSISTEEVQSTWPQPYFKYRKQITINNNQVNSPLPLSNFPLLVNITDADLRDKTQPDGDDIIFTDVTGTKLDHEIEYFDQRYSSSQAHLIAWVRVPVLHATVDTNLFMYYGNLTTGSQENPSGVWDSNYKGVWHLSENPADIAPQFKDSTSNNNHGTSNNLVSGDQFSGQIDGALNFTSSDQDYINIGDQSSLNMGTGDFSVELWFNYDGSNNGPLVGKGAYGGGGKRYYVALENDQIKGEIDDDVTKHVIYSSTYTDSIWHHVVFTKNGNSLSLYLDGVEVVGSPIDVSGIGNLDMALPFYIGTLASDPGGTISDWTNVLMDEIRVSNIARSTNWIETEFNNQLDPDSFYSINTEEKQANWTESPVIVEWVYGDSENINSVSTNTSILGVSNQLYIAAVSVKNYQDTTSVSGLGLTWIELEEQPGGRSQTGISVWYAIGQSPTTGIVTATSSVAPKASVLQVLRIANVNPSNPIGNHESANTNGENGAGSGGIDDTYAFLDIITTSTNTTVLGLIGQRGRITTPGAGFTKIADNKIGSGGDIAGLTSEYKFTANPETVMVNATFNIATDWAIVGIELNPLLESVDQTAPVINDFGIYDPGTGSGIFWANVTDDNAVNSVTVNINSTMYPMTYNGSLWIYQTAVIYDNYYAYQIINSSDSSNNYLLSPTTEKNYTFNIDNINPTVDEWIYDNSLGYNGTFRANVSDSWGIIDMVYVTVTICQCVSSNTAIMQKSGSEYINDSILMKSGSIFFEITVIDTANNIFTSTVHSGTVLNKAPSASNLTFSPSTVTSNDSLTFNYDFFDIDDDTEFGTEIRWYNNSVLQPTFNDQTIIPLSALYKGDQWYATVRPKDGNLFGSLVTSPVITIENTLPVASNVIINPSSAVNTTTLTISYSYSDIDSDSENIANREIRWYKNGIWESTYDNSLTLPNTATKKSETWNFRIRVHDGFNYSLWVNSTSVEIKNSAPTASNIEILNPTPKTTDDLVANWTYNDIDIDPENPGWIILWFRNDVLQGNSNNSKTLSSGYTNKTDIWYFKLQVFDGTNYSILYQSQNVQVVNTAPSASNIDITQNPYTTDDLVASWTFNDVDGDTQSGILNITWYKNGVYQSGYNNLTTILSSETIKGEKWIYLVQVYDGESLSIRYNSSDYGKVALILNSAPTTSNEEIVNQNPYTTNNLVASWDEADNDGVGDIDSGIVNITWYKNGIQISIYNNKTQVNSTDTQKGEQWNFIIQIHDGETFSIPKNSSYVIILNSLPTAINRKFNTSSVTTNDDFNISYVFSDADGDLEVTANLIVYWFINGTYYSAYDNQTIIYSSNTTEGSFYYYIIRVYDGTQYSDNLTSLEGIVIGFGSSNDAPEVSNLAITPLNPTTTDNLIVSYSYYDVNGDPEFGSEIRWYKNGILQPSLNDSLIVSFSFTTKGENWYFTVKPKDGLLFGSLNSSLNFTIKNTAPTASGLELTQNPVTTQNLITSWNFADVDGDIESVLYNITWYRNGIYLSQFNNQTQISSSFTNKSESWYYLIQVYDGENYSQTYNSSTNGQIAYIINSIPTASSLRFNTTFPHKNEAIYANWTFTDADNDLEVASWIILWYKSNVLQPTLNNSRMINNTSKNQVWFFKLQVFDGENYSLIYQSPTIQIINTAPTVTNLNITAFPQTDENLDAFWIFQDLDGDSASIIINLTWYKDGIHQSSLNNISSVPSSMTSKGEIWHYLLQVYDGEIFSLLYNSSESGVFAIILNSIPIASNLFIQSPNPYTTDDLEPSWTYYDADGDPQSGIINITWYNNGILVPFYNNASNLPAIATMKGEQWNYILQVYDGQNFSVAQNSSLVTIINSIPKIISIPTFNKTTGIKTNDSIEIRYNYTDSDNDPNNIANLTVVWFLFGFENYAKENQTILYASETEKGQFWTYKLQVFDGEAYSIIYDSIIIQIENSLPEVQGSLIITPINPTPGDTLTLSYIWNDADVGDFERDTEILWYKNNVLQNFNNSLSISGVYIIKGDMWNVTVRVSDGTSYGNLEFHHVYIGNSIPEILTNNISPIPAYTSTQLIVNSTFAQHIIFYDDDSDPIVWIEYRWFVDGVENSTYYNQTLIPANATVKGEQWWFSVQISDGENYSLVFNSSKLTIQNSRPLVYNVSISPTYAVLYTSNTLDLVWNYSDADLDSEVLQEIMVTWFLNGQPQSNLANLTSVPSNFVSKGQFWKVEVQVFDGSSYSAIGEFGPRIIQNSPGNVIDVQINNNLSTTSSSNSLILSWNFLDADGDPQSGIRNITWYKSINSGVTWVYQPYWNNQTNVNYINLTKTEIWYARVNVFDGQSWSTIMDSQSITIINSIPIIEEIIFINTEYQHFIVEDEDIQISYLFSDTDVFDNDNSKIMWYINGVHIQDYDDLTTISADKTVPGQVWGVQIIPSDGFDSGPVVFSGLKTIEDRPEILAFGATSVNDIEGHYILWFDVLANPINASGSFASVDLIITVNNSDQLRVVANSNGTHFNYDLQYTDYNLLGSEVLVEIEASSKVRYDNIISIISDFDSFIFYLEDSAPPRVKDVDLIFNNEENPTELTFYVMIEEFGSGIENATLYYTFKDLSQSNTSESNPSIILPLRGKITQNGNILLENSFLVPLSELNSTHYSITVDFIPNGSVLILYQIQVFDKSGNFNPNAYPDGLDESQALRFTPPGISIEEILPYITLLIVIIIVFSFIINRKFRSKELVGLDIDMVMENIKKLKKKEEEIEKELDAHTLGIVISFFDQRHGPIPVLFTPEMLRDNYNKLLELSDVSFSTGRFVNDFQQEVQSSFDFEIGNDMHINTLSYSFSLDRPNARGGAENIVLNILVYKDVFPLIVQFSNEISPMIANIHKILDIDPNAKENVIKDLIKLRKLISQIVLSHIELYGTIETDVDDFLSDY